MHSEHNTKMSLTNICGYCLAYIGTSHQDFTWKQLFVSGIAFTEYRGFILYWLPVERQREICGNECSALFESYLRCRSWSQCHCSAENFFLSCPWWLSWWGAMDRNSSLRGPSSLLPLAVPFSMSNPSSRLVTRKEQGAFPLCHQHKLVVWSSACAVLTCDMLDLWCQRHQRCLCSNLFPKLLGGNLILNAHVGLQGHRCHRAGCVHHRIMESFRLGKKSLRSTCPIPPTLTASSCWQAIEKGCLEQEGCLDQI